jgi:SseB protein C-terminal domain/SseB protein N-terminal domain
MTPTGPDFPAHPRGHDGGPHGPYGPAEFHGSSGPYRPLGPGGRHRPYPPDARDGTGARREAAAAGGALPLRGIVMQDAGRAHTARNGRPWPDGDVVAQALAAVVKDGERISELLDVLSRGRLWLPLPSDGGPVTDGSAIQLPTVVYLGAEFVPAFTSAELLVACAHGHAEDAGYIPEPGWSAAGRHHIPEPGRRHHAGWMADRVPSTRTGPRRPVPHIVVPAAELARRLPSGLGIALNPGAHASVPIYPEGVTYLAAAEWEAGDARIRLGQPPVEPESLLREVSAGLRPIPAAQQASRAWLSVPGEGEGLIIAVILDDPADERSQAAVLAAVEHAAGAAGPAARFPIDVTFPGEREADDVDRWITEHAMPFHLRA